MYFELKYSAHLTTAGRNDCRGHYNLQSPTNEPIQNQNDKCKSFVNNDRWPYMRETVFRMTNILI